ncbi:phosphopantetheine-binding protein [Streptomyces beigongshangae]|uniref:phosphopantetheine-binding protein n=1 Tax=Streptomyces beigongshangae TaxID=2841597 RepID=UPI001C858E24|nr:acyl carrier protein [Streptomyces sp. REN17]
MLTTPPDLDSTIARYATADFGDSTSIQEAGLESLSLLRLAVEVADEDAEIDAAGLADLRTVGDLKGWLAGLLPNDTDTTNDTNGMNGTGAAC